MSFIVINENMSKLTRGDEGSLAMCEQILQFGIQKNSQNSTGVKAETLAQTTSCEQF
jgi:hypothetical protein